jgi:hypothetical protein
MLQQTEELQECCNKQKNYRNASNNQRSKIAAAFLEFFCLLSIPVFFCLLQHSCSSSVCCSIPRYMYSTRKCLVTY